MNIQFNFDENPGEFGEDFIKLIFLWNKTGSKYLY